MTDLIQRLESATAKEQGSLLKEAVRYARDRGWIDDDTMGSALHWASVGAFESAAMTLVPEGQVGAYEPFFYEDGNRIAYRGVMIRPRWDDWTPVSDDWLDRIDGWGATPAIALCIAALTAREAE